MRDDLARTPSPGNPDQGSFDEAMKHTAHRPFDMPGRPWRLRQRWRDLLFAHWPIPSHKLQPLLPDGLEADTFDGSAWVGVVPFWMDLVQTRSVAAHSFGVPSAQTFNELNLRTYVRSRRTGKAGVFFFALDCDSPLAVLGARTLFHLPYFPAWMGRSQPGGPGSLTGYSSTRRFSRRPVRFGASYSPAGAVLTPSQPGSLEHFITERYSLFTPAGNRLLVGDIHHQQWALQPAEAEIFMNEQPAAHRILLPDQAPVLHFSRELFVTLWSLRPE
jgi:uncharacterized protein YqjF (DUF2071 family)